jgi:hypothetical protein
MASPSSSKMLQLVHAQRSFSKSGGRLRGDVCRPHEGALFYDIG